MVASITCAMLRPRLCEGVMLFWSHVYCLAVAHALQAECMLVCVSCLLAHWPGLQCLWEQPY